MVPLVRQLSAEQHINTRAFLGPIEVLPRKKEEKS